MIEIKDEHISTLLLKKIIGSISPNEEMELDAWRKGSEENETLYQKMLDHTSSVNSANVPSSTRRDLWQKCFNASLLTKQ